MTAPARIRSGAIRLVYWLVHRALPDTIVINLLVGAKLGVREPLPRLRWPELAIDGWSFGTRVVPVLQLDGPVGRS